MTTPGDSVSLYDSRGRQLRGWRVNAGTLAGPGDLTPGVYFLRAETPRGPRTVRFVVLQ